MYDAGQIRRILPFPGTSLFVNSDWNGPAVIYHEAVYQPGPRRSSWKTEAQLRASRRTDGGSIDMIYSERAISEVSRAILDRSRRRLNYHEAVEG